MLKFPLPLIISIHRLLRGARPCSNCRTCTDADFNPQAPTRSPTYADDDIVNRQGISIHRLLRGARQLWMVRHIIPAIFQSTGSYAEPDKGTKRRIIRRKKFQSTGSYAEPDGCQAVKTGMMTDFNPQAPTRSPTELFK